MLHIKLDYSFSKSDDAGGADDGDGVVNEEKLAVIPQGEMAERNGIEDPGAAAGFFEGLPVVFRQTGGAHAVDQHALHVSHVFHHPRHDVAGAPRIEPLERQTLDFFIKIRADIEDHLLLEDVVDENPQRIQAVFHEESEQRQDNPKRKLMVPGRIGDNFIDHMAGRIRENKNRHGHSHGTEKLSSS